MTIIYIVLAVVIFYGLAKVFMYIYRPFGINKYIRQIEENYNHLLLMGKRDIDSANEDLKSWNSGESNSAIPDYEERIKERLDSAQESIEYEAEVHRKFLRLLEKFIGNYSRIGDAIVTYGRYLQLRTTQKHNGEIFSRSVTSGIMSLDDFRKSALDMQARIEEVERKLDMLLSETQPSK